MFLRNQLKRYSSCVCILICNMDIIPYERLVFYGRGIVSSGLLVETTTESVKHFNRFFLVINLRYQHVQIMFPAVTLLINFEVLLYLSVCCIQAMFVLLVFLR